MGTMGCGEFSLLIPVLEGCCLQAQKVASVLRLPQPSLEDHMAFPGPADTVGHRGHGCINSGKFVPTTNGKILSFPFLSASMPKKPNPAWSELLPLLERERRETLSCITTGMIPQWTFQWDHFY